MVAASLFILPLTFATVALAGITRRATTTGNIATANNPNLCLVPRNNAVGNGTPVVVAPCSQVTSPWTFDDTLNRFSVAGTNQCLDVTDGVNADGTRLQTWECTGGPNQKFTTIASPRGTSIQWIGKNKCADVTDGAFAAGTAMQIWTCTSGPNQLFSFPPPTGHIVFKTTAHTEFCIDVAAASNANGTPLQIFTCNGTPAQNFTAEAGGFHVLNTAAIDLTDGVQTNGNKLQIWTAFPGNTNQQWTYDSGRKALRLTANQNKCIDVTDGVFANRTRLQIWDCTFGPNQQFTEVPA